MSLWQRRLAVCAVVASLTVTLVAAPPGTSAPTAAAAERHGGRPHPQKVWKPREVNKLATTPAVGVAAGTKNNVTVPASAPAVAPAWPVAETVDAGIDATTASTKPLSSADRKQAALAGLDQTPAVVTVDAPGTLTGAAKKATATPSTTTSGVTAPGSVRVTVADHAAAVAAGVSGVIVSVARSDGSTSAGAADIAISYASWAQAFGGNFSDRLALVTLPACALTTPSVPACRVPTPVRFFNDRVHQQLIATVDLPADTAAPAAAAVSGAPSSATIAPNTAQTSSASAKLGKTVVMAATSTSAGANGSYSVSSLKASDSWSVSGNSGSFEWSYPVNTPASLGAGGTGMSLSYDSGSVDGRSTATSGQPSSLGEGFDLGGASSYIETTYKPCNKVDPTHWATSGDMCVGTANASISGGAHAGQLVRDDTDTTKWRLSTDDGTRVQLLSGTTGGTNGSGVITGTGLTANTSTYWKLTGTDGTVYLYGANRLPQAVYNGAGSDNPTYSAWAEPVFGTGTGTSCNDPTSAVDPQTCLSVWRWNLDFVIDPHGNVTRYSYAREAGFYMHKSATTQFTSSGFLREIDYGWQTGDVAKSTGLLADGNAAGAWPAATVRPTYLPRCVYDAVNNPSCPTAAPTVSDGAATTGIVFPGGTGTVNTSAFPDVPADQHCYSGQTSCAVYSPAFFSTVRLTGVQTAVNNGAAIANQPTWAPANYEAVDSYQFTQSFPTPQDSSTGNRAQLQLNAVVHTGYLTNSDGTVATTTAPAMNLGYEQDANRVIATWNSLSQGTTAAQFYRFRLNDITDELGGETKVSYGMPSALNCNGTAAAPPVTISNNMLCYPEYFNNNGTMTIDWYNKYLVTAVTKNDNTLKGTSFIYSAPHTANYTYLGNPAWHTNDSEQADPSYRTVDGFRGFRQVQVLSAGETSGHNSKTVTTFFQGMDQDPTAYVCLNDSHTQAPANANCPGGFGYRDDNALMGQALEVQTYASDASNTIVADDITVPEDPTDSGTGWSMVTAQHTRASGLPVQRAHWSHVQKKITYGQLSTSQTPRRSEIDYTFDNSLPTFTGSGGVGGNGRELLIDDKGDGTVPELCTFTTYAGNTNLGVDGVQWTAYPMTTITSTVPSGSACTTTSETADTTVSQNQNIYDNQSPGTVKYGDVTATQAAPSFNATWVTTGQAIYDGYGRPISKIDGDNHTTVTTYNPTGTLLPRQISTKNPALWTSTITLDRGHGVTLTTVDVNGRQSDGAYDGLGRATAAWTTDHSRFANPNSPVTKYTYGLFGTTLGATTAATNAYVGTQILREDGSYASSYSILDGFGDQIQTQTTPVDGSPGLVSTQTEYNSLGKPWRSAAANPDSAHNPSGTFINYGDSLPSETQTVYDGLSRPLTTAAYHNGSPVTGAVTTMAYPGVDRTDATAAAGNGTVSSGATSTFTDVRGRTTALWTYHNSPPSPTGITTDADITTYGFSYVASGTQSTVTDATKQNTWTTTTTDLLNRHTVKQDPDAGTSQTWNDNAGLLLQSQDGRGQTLSFTYDNLGRKAGEYNTASTELTLDANNNITAINPGAAPPATTARLASWTYDSAGSSDGKTTLGLPATSTRWTGNGANAYTTTIPGYDAGARPLETTVSIPNNVDGNGALAGSYQTNLSYTPVTGLLDHTDLPAAGGLSAETVYNSYNVNGLLLATGGNNDYVVDTQYDQIGRILSRTLGDYPYQVVQQNLYDAATGRLTNVFTDATAGQNASNPSQLNTYSVDDLSYTYDAAGQLTSSADLQNWTSSGYNPGSPARDLQCYTYDYAGRLTNAWADKGDQTPSATTNLNSPTTATAGLGSCADSITNNPPTAASALGGPAPYWQTYTFDANGALTDNRSTIKDHDVTGNTANDVTRTSTYPAAGTQNTLGSTPPTSTAGGTGPHLLTQVAHNGGGSDTFVYDGAGNTTTRTLASGANQTLTWDAEGRLATVTDNSTSPPTTATYLYDADGNQLMRRDAKGTSGTTTLYLGTTELQLNTSPGANTVTGNRYYAYPAAPAIIAGSNGAITYEITNSQGTGGTTLNAANNQITARRYTKPFGDARGTTPTNWVDDHTFLGKTTDTSTGLVDVGARKYDNAAGRFISADPLFQASSPQGIGGYAYAGNDPVSASDPTGLDPLTCAVGAHHDSSTGQMRCVYDTVSDTKTNLQNKVNNEQAKLKADDAEAAALRARIAYLKSHSMDCVESRLTGYCADPSKITVTDMVTFFGVMLAAGLASAVIVQMAADIGAACTVGWQMCLGALGDAAASVGVALTPGAAPAWTYSGEEQAADAVLGGLEKDTANLDTTIAQDEQTLASLNCSFTGDTRILMADGSTKPIDAIKPGDKITNAIAGEKTTGVHTVTAVHVSDDDKDFVDLTVATPAGPKTVQTTGNHRFFDATTGAWAPAADLKAGDNLDTPGEGRARILATHRYTAHKRMYNLTIDGVHTYYVEAGDISVLVHNVCGFDREAEQALLPSYDGTTVGSGVANNGVDFYALSGNRQNDKALMDIVNQRLRGLGRLPGQSKSGFSDHVEQKIAAMMLQDDSITEAEIVINNPTGPCGAPNLGCNKGLMDALLGSKKLTVWWQGSDGEWQDAVFGGS